MCQGQAVCEGTAFTEPLPSDRCSGRGVQRARRAFLSDDVTGAAFSSSSQLSRDALVEARWLICFNRISKVTPEAFADWMQIMGGSNAVWGRCGSPVSAGSVLLLMAESSEAQREIEVRFGICSTSNRSNIYHSYPLINSPRDLFMLLSEPAAGSLLGHSSVAYHFRVASPPSFVPRPLVAV